MDTERLLRILTDLESDENLLAISDKVGKIRADLAQNNQEGYQLAIEDLNAFKKEAEEKSIIYNFSRTENIILQTINGAEYFGQGLTYSLENINLTRGFEVLKKIDDFIAERNQFLAKIKKIKSDLLELGIKEYKPDQYEIGIVLPNDVGTANNVHKIIKDFELLIVAIQELVLDRKEEVKITRLNNNSLDFFFSQQFAVAVALTTLLANLIVIWDKIAGLNKQILETDGHSSFSEESKTRIKEIIKKEITAAKQEIFEKIPEKVLQHVKKEVDAGRKNELVNQIRIKLKAAFKWFELGVEVDIIPVRIENQVKVSTPEDLEAGQKEEYKKEINQLFKKTNHSIQEFYKLPLDIRKLPFQLESGEEEDESEKNKE